MQAAVIPREKHCISQENIDPDAITVIRALRDHGYIAYLVGGGVRDLLLGQRPKDFDISTSAKPEEVKKIFRRNCLMIGRRFRLAHVRFGKKIFEVSTFRAGDNDADQLIVRDNEWGTPEEDVLRRDFTINGLFYDLDEDTVIDYVGGYEDIKERKLRSIGDAEKRFKQDPVRMIRLLKFVARLKFRPEPEALEALKICRQEILKSAPARILEEILRMLESGSSVPFFHLMVDHDLLGLLLPEVHSFMKIKKKEEVFNLLKAADSFHQQQAPKKLRRSVLASCLLFPIIDKSLREKLLPNDENPHYGKIAVHIGDVMREYMMNNFVTLPKRLRASVEFILNAQYRFCPLHPSRKFKTKRFLQQPELSSAVKFLSLRERYNPELGKAYTHWQNLYTKRKQERGSGRPVKNHEASSSHHP